MLDFPRRLLTLLLSRAREVLRLLERRVLFLRLLERFVGLTRLLERIGVLFRFLRDLTVRLGEYKAFPRTASLARTLLLFVFNASTFFVLALDVLVIFIIRR